MRTLIHQKDRVIFAGEAQLKIQIAGITGIGSSHQSLTKKYGKYPAMKLTTVLTGQANLAAQGNTETPV
jgi:hypothetical protein